METRRVKFRKGLNSLYLPVYDTLCSELGEHWQPYYGIRTFEQQDDLYAQGRTKPGLKVTNAKSGESPHNYGCASDWTLWENGKPIWNKNDKRWVEYEYACAKAGAYWGGNFNDYPHNELALKVRWSTLLKIHENLGADAVQDFIKKNLA